ncbi:DUF4367 domain-containing protein [Paenibacillus senegalensis]|uniref:DUF4367 domain-containing protein n=1 Tax=Paenibacillus senegalensis TaxID=1465766 RepID=UPI0002DF2A3F|nr:DUF4367 domain-containing protein [Paenibacillus senegalensis]
MIFSQIELSDHAKNNIRQQAIAEKAGRRFFFSKAWIMGMGALAAAVIMLVGLPNLQQPNVPSPVENPGGSLPPSHGGAGGSELSQLITTTLSSAEEAKEAFGPGLLVPSFVPEGFELAEIVAVGMKGEPVRDVNFTYISGDKTLTFAVSRNPAAFPAELFTPTQVNGVEGFVFEQPGLTELFWVEEGIQYSITGPLSADEAMKIAQSIEP